MGRAAIALFTATCFVGACGTSWPRPVAAIDPGMAAHTKAITRVDVLPMDLAVWTDGKRGDPEVIRLRGESALGAAIATALYQRGYLPGAQIGWDGAYMGDDGAPHNALAPAAVLGTVEVMSSYGLEAAQRGGLPQPPLPARLGASGAEATLYVGGWAFVGEDNDSGGGGTKVLKVVAIAAIVVIAVIAIAAVAKSKGKGSSSIGKAADGVAHAAAATGRVAFKTLARAGNVAIEVGRVTVNAADRLVRPRRMFPRLFFDPGLDLYVTSRDPYGPPAWYPTAPPPPWEQRPSAPRTGRSTLYLEMTLVDNRDGRALWHVAQRFPASGASEADVTRAAQAMLSTLPTAH